MKSGNHMWNGVVNNEFFFLESLHILTMSNVREVIELLCKILHSNGTTKIKAEHFRLAKFDNSEATLLMWKLLFELLYFLDHSVIDEVVIKAYNELSTEEQVVYIKQGLQEIGFYSRDFATLPNDMSRGSRELLLALAWLLGTQNVMDKFMETCASPLSSDFPESTAVPLDASANNQSTQSLSPVEKVQQLQHLNGKLYLSLKRLHTLQREKGKLQHKVHESTMGASTFPDKTHLSVLEVHFLRHPDYLKKLLKLLEKDNIRLQNMLLWKELENVFWKWMESVHDLKMQETKEEKDNTAMKFYNIPADILDRLTIERGRLEEAILQYESIIEQIEEIWDSKSDEVSQSELDRLLKVIDMELAFHKANIGLDKSNQLKSKYKDPQFVWTKPTNKRATNIQRVGNVITRTDDGLGETFDIDDEIHGMEMLIDRLEFQANQKESFYRHELDRLASNIPDAVCIQPTSLR